MYFGKSKISLIWELGLPYSICHQNFFFSFVHLLGISEGMKHFLLVDSSASWKRVFRSRLLMCPVYTGTPGKL